MCFRNVYLNSHHSKPPMELVLLSPFHSWEYWGRGGYKVRRSLETVLADWVDSVFCPHTKAASIKFFPFRISLPPYLSCNLGLVIHKLQSFIWNPWDFWKLEFFFLIEKGTSVKYFECTGEVCEAFFINTVIRVPKHEPSDRLVRNKK